MKRIGQNALVGLLVIVVAACGSDSSKSAIPPRQRTFVLDEWSVTPPSEPLPAGEVELRATNKGEKTHELVIIKAKAGDVLPTNLDGSLDEAKLRKGQKVGEIAGVAAGETVTETMDLPAGDYLAVCNLVEGTGTVDLGNGPEVPSGGGYVHYQLGMVAPFTVT